MTASDTPRGRRINWNSVSTIVSAAVLIGAEVFGGAFAGGWALGYLLDLGATGSYVLQGLLFVAGLGVMVAFIRTAQKAESFYLPD